MANTNSHAFLLFNERAGISPEPTFKNLIDIKELLEKIYQPAISAPISATTPDTTPLVEEKKETKPKKFDANAPDLWEPLIQRLIADGFDETKIRSDFQQLGIKFTSVPMGNKIMELYSLRYGGFSSYHKDNTNLDFEVDDELKPVAESSSLASCRNLVKENKELFAEVEKKYGVPSHIIVSLLLVETNLGQDLGSEPAFYNLASMALSNSIDHVATRISKLKLGQGQKSFVAQSLLTKSDWAYEELKALLNYATAIDMEIMKIPGSMYGAVGICQFMPSNVPLYGVDADADGKINLFQLADAVHSVASYLQQNGWRKGLTPIQQLAVLRTYNHDSVYAYTVQAVATRLSAKGKASNAMLAQNPLNLVRPAGVYRYRGARSGVKLKPVRGYSDLLGINPNPKPLSTLKKLEK
ncbi:lytic murein transglycosylase [Desulfovibrio litoralis]|nr:lytic murein transglycosylase [Desulfovibrio litoralis]